MQVALRVVIGGIETANSQTVRWFRPTIGSSTLLTVCWSVRCRGPLAGLLPAHLAFAVEHRRAELVGAAAGQPAAVVRLGGAVPGAHPSLL